jgi:hypothetical protein
VVSVKRKTRKKRFRPATRHKKGGRRRQNAQPVDLPLSICFLVGAGIVKDAQLPLSADLARKFNEQLEALASSADKATRGLLALNRFLNGGIRFQMGVLNRDPEQPINIEHLATAALRLNERMENPVAPYVSGWNSRLIDLEQANPAVLQRFLEMIYAGLNDWLRTPSAEAIVYLARINDFRRFTAPVDVFSLNYDLCIETALQDSGVEFVNGFTQFGWNPTALQSAASVRLFKLHGSLDWVENDSFGICSTKFPVHDRVADFEGEDSPLLIFGTNTKLTGRDPFLTLLYHFSARIAACDVLISIGYGFADEHVNQVIEQKLITNSKLHLVLVSPDATEKIATTAFLTARPRILALDKGAKTALNDGDIDRMCRRLLRESRVETPF